MTLSFNHLPRIFVAASAIVLSGCSAAAPDPASEAPVELAAGEYQVEFSGQAPTMFGTTARSDMPTGMNKKICLAAPDDDAKVAKLARAYLSMHADCDHDGDDRVGNSVKGSVMCRTDPERMPGGLMGQNYTGTLATDTIRLEGQMVMDLPTSSMTPEMDQTMKDYAEMTKDIRIVVEAKRIGEC